MGAGAWLRAFANLAEQVWDLLDPEELERMADKVAARDANSTGADDWFAARLRAIAKLKRDIQGGLAKDDDE